MLIEQRQQLGIQHLWLDYDTSKEFGRTLTDLFDAQNILDAVKPDLVIFSDCCPLSNLAAKGVANQIGIPYIIVEGFVAPYLAERFTSYLEELEKIYTQARAVIAVSTENLNLLHQFFRLPKGKGQVIYYGRPEHYFAPPIPSVRDRLRQDLEIPANAVVCFTAARLDPIKGFQYQLEAIQQLKQSEIWSQLYFIWAGTGVLEAQLKAELEKLEVTNRVKLIGERSDIKDWLDTADIFILPSQLEGMPLAIMEAMAKGLSVIATAVSGIPEELGETGKLLSDPKIDPQATVRELVTTIQTWTINPEFRYNQGQAAKQRAEAMFKEEKMVEDTLKLLENSLLPVGDYISPGFSIIRPDRCFPNMIVGDTRACGWSYLRREIPHNWYVDKRQPTVGFLSRDEAHILYNTALKFRGKKALEIGCWLGWSACHLALAGVELDVIDPLLDKPEMYDSVSTSLKDAGVFESVNLVAGYSPQKVEELAKESQRKWSLIFIDGDHDAPGPLNDAIICEQLAETNALILFHDLSSPDVAQGLDYLKQRGWNTMIYQTMQIMGVAWRGNIEPVQHISDPSIKWQLPVHLQHYIVSDTQTNQINQLIPSNKGNFFEYQQQNDSEFQKLLCAVRSYTLLSEERLFSLYSLAKKICLDNITGNFVECGTCKGGSAAVLAYIVKNYSKQPRLVYAFDTFEGMPEPTECDRHQSIPANSTGFGSGTLKAPISENLEVICEILDVKQIVIPVKGLFSETLPKYKFKIGNIALLHADGDWYESTIDIFKNLYDSVVSQGYIQVDDYGHWEGCKKAIHDFETLKGKQFKLHQIDYTGVWFQKNDKYIDAIVEKYQQAGSDSSITNELRHLRKQIAEYWLSADTNQIEQSYVSKINEGLQSTINSGIQNEELTEDEEQLLNEILVNISKGFDQPKAIQYLLAAMLYQRSDQLPLQPDLTYIPQWLLNDYLKYIFEFPRLFQEIGEADNYYRYLQRWLDYLQENISNNPESALWQYIAKFFLQTANFIPLYFTTENVKEIYTKRADIMEFALKIQGCQIDYDFPERSAESKKIRLGILAAHYNPQTETFTTLPIYKHLNRDIFEIILYTLNSNNHRLERYCAGHGDALITLPQDLPSQVQVIRENELDILLIGTNLTAVTNQVTLLALHRLARIQVASTSSCVTTGMRNVDYYISGKLTEPDNDAQQHYTETLVTIDGPAHCHDFATEEHILPTIRVSRESLGINRNDIVYISGANFYKIIPEVEAVWAKIIASVPNSKLVLYPFNPNWSSSYPVVEFKKRITSTFTQYGIGEEQLIILNPVPNRADVKERLKIADVYLDSFPFSSINSLIDPLEVGLPIVMRDGNSFRSLMGSALLRELKVDNLITNSEETYIQLAVELGTNPELRKQKSDRIFQKMQQNPSFLDSRSYSAKMGALFQQLFQQDRANNLIDRLGLRDINLVMFPDWHQSEKSLYEDFANVLKTMSSNPDKSRMTLLIDTDGIDGEDANWLFSSVAMNLLMEEAVDIADELEVSLLDDLTENEWELLLSLLQGRISSDNENQNALAKAKAQSLKVYG